MIRGAKGDISSGLSMASFMLVAAVYRIGSAGPFKIVAIQVSIGISMPFFSIEICRSQLAQMPGHMSGQIVFGQALYEAGEFDEARQVFERALTLDPENLIALRSLGDMSLQSGDTTEARRWYMRLLDADPKDTAVIALVSEIDASAEAEPIPTPKSVPIDSDAGDQPGGAPQA